MVELGVGGGFCFSASFVFYLTGKVDSAKSVTNSDIYRNLSSIRSLSNFAVNILDLRQLFKF